jgi:hypothetical protein
MIRHFFYLTRSGRPKLTILGQGGCLFGVLFLACFVVVMLVMGKSERGGATAKAGPDKAAATSSAKKCPAGQSGSWKRTEGGEFAWVCRTAKGSTTP